MKEPFDQKLLFGKSKMYKIYSPTLGLFSKGGTDTMMIYNRLMQMPPADREKYKVYSGWGATGKTWNTRSAFHTHLTYFDKIPDDWRIIELSANGIYQMSIHDEWSERYDVNGEVIKKSIGLF